MKKLHDLSEIVVPEAQADHTYTIRYQGKDFCFKGLKLLLAKADFLKAGERGSGLSSDSELERISARSILSSMTLQHLFNHPLLTNEGEIDCVMRVNYDIDGSVFKDIALWTVEGLKKFLLESPQEKIKKITAGLTGVMVSAVTKLMDVHELIYVASKITNKTQARTKLGIPGTLASRIQPNYPSDDLRGISLLTYLSLSMGGGDALIGVNPAIDTMENVSKILFHLDKIRRSTGVPTQICVLSHIKTQLECLKKGAPVEILFQSLAGTEKTLEEFDITIELLDSAYYLMKENSPLVKEGAKHFLYFETGQGSEYSYGKHEGIDMTTCEALTYGLARRYDPFMVNNVTGFIGPETHENDNEMILSNLQDHFMGKLLGLPMGMAPCYTLHSKITSQGQQIATQLLASAGANYFMDVYLNVDRMLAYFDTGSHDNQTLREIHKKEPSPELLEWALQKQIYQRTQEGEVIRGPLWGDPTIFCENDDQLKEMISATPSVYGSFVNFGPRPSNKVMIEVRANEAVAKEAVYAELDIDEVKLGIPLLHLKTNAEDKEKHLSWPNLGCSLHESSKQLLYSEDTEISVVVSDGLSAQAVMHNIYELLPVILDGIKAKQITCSESIVVPYGRVKLAEPIARIRRNRLVLMLIGERPGGDASSCKSLSAYFAYYLKDPKDKELAVLSSGNHEIEFEYSVISNIYDKGIPPAEAGSVIVEKIVEILSYRCAGNRLEAMLK